MDFNWKLFLSALGLAFVLEGIPYVLLADRMPEFLRMLSERPPAVLRSAGLLAIAAGLGLLFLLRLP